jgi:hypothetical protein
MIVRVLLKLNEDFILNDLLRNDFSQKNPILPIMGRIYKAINHNILIISTLMSRHRIGNLVIRIEIKTQYITG